MEFGLEAGQGEPGVLVQAANLRRVTSRLLASTILYSASVGLSSPTFAQQSAPTSAQSRAIQFSIAAQPLPAAINTFIRATGWQVGYSTRITDGLRSTAVSGSMPPAQALRTLLSGTGISVRFTGANTATLVSPSVAAGSLPDGAIQLDQIDVQGAGNPNSTMTPMPAYAGGQVATGGQLGMLGNRSVMNTPFNQTSYTQKTIHDQQARTLEDVLDNDPSVRPMAGAGSGFNAFFIRGFSFDGTDAGLNGLYGIAPTGSAINGMVERVEVLKGPTALLNGMPPLSSVGGAVNLVTKRAGDEPLTQLTTGFVPRGHGSVHLDVGRRFGEGNACGARFNGTLEGGETSIENNDFRLGQAALGLDCRTENFRVSADFIYQSQKLDGATRFVRFNTGVPVLQAPDASKSVVPSWWGVNSSSKLAMLNAEYDLTSNITAYAAVGALDNGSIQINGFPTVIDTSGNFLGSARAIDSYTRGISAQGGIRGNFDTGPVKHAVNINVSHLDREQGTGLLNGTAFSSNIYNPAFVPDQNLRPPAAKKSSALTLSSVGISDTLSILDERVQFTVGVRRQQVNSANFNTATGAQTAAYDSYAWSPAYAVLVKPLENVSLYANYIEGLQPGQVIGAGFSNEGQVFAPYQTKQFEAGVKVDWGRVTTTASFFQITQPSAITIPGTPLPSMSIDGENRNRGVELNAFGALTDDLRLLGGVMFIDGRQVSTANGLNDGKKAIGVPDVQVNFGAEWDTPFVKGLTLGGRVIYTSAQYVTPDNTQRIPGWTRFDLGARYTFEGPWNKPIVVRFDVRNVFDKNYWNSVNFGYVGLGAPRTFLLSTTFNF